MYSSWLNLLKWKIFLKNYSGENYVVYHNYQYDHILRNILLNSKFIKTIHYKHTNTENIFNYKIKHKKNYINNDQLYLLSKSYDGFKLCFDVCGSTKNIYNIKFFKR